MIPLDALQALRVLVVHPRDNDGETIMRQLLSVGCQTEEVWPPPYGLPDRTQVVFYLLDKVTVKAIPWAGVPRQAAVIAIVGANSHSIRRPNTPSTFRLLNHCCPQAVISKPVRAVDVLTSLMSARRVFRYEECLVTKVRKLEETIRAARKVEKAKGILMRSKNLDERTAYKYLRESAMNRRVSISSIASAVIDTSEIFAEGNGGGIP